MSAGGVPDVGRLAGGFVLLVGLWIAVYWWWEPSEPPITFADDSAETSLAPPPVPSSASVKPAASSASTARKADEKSAAPAPSSEPRPPSVPPKSATPPGANSRVVEAPEFIEYVVQDGDTFEKIGRRFFGSAGKSGIIARANPFVDPTRLRAGRILRIPKDPGNVQGKIVQVAPADSPQSPTYTVQPGDTLGGISDKLYGTSTRAALLFEANRDRLSTPDAIKPGQILVVPEPPKE